MKYTQHNSVFPSIRCKIPLDTNQGTKNQEGYRPRRQVVFRLQ